jgi:chromosome segregation ATPase
MATKISSYRTGAPRFGTKGHVQTWDNSVKVSYLSPEELEEYRSGRKGGSRMYTHEDYLQFQKDGLSNTEIAKKMNISQATLYNRLKVWKQQPLKSEPKNVQVPQERKEKTSEGESEQNGKSGELMALIATLKAEKAEHEEKVKKLEDQLIESDYKIEKLELDCHDFMEQAATANQLSEQWKKKLQEAEDNLQEVLSTNENLHKEIVVMNNSLARSTELLNGASDEIEKLTRKYEDLKREVEPLRQLALMKLQQDVSA